MKMRIYGLIVGILVLGCSSYKSIKAPTTYKFIEDKIIYDHGYYRDFVLKDSIKIFSTFKEWYGTYSNPYWTWDSYMPLKVRSAPRGGSYNTLMSISKKQKAQ
jgi:hypothetical protein